MAGALSEDRKLAAEVRRLTLTKIKKLLIMDLRTASNRDNVLHDEILKKLASSVLPRLNEISAAEDVMMPVPIMGGLSVYKGCENCKRD
jgi:hypothetical protein